jgi:hypothetical protein
MKILIKSLKKKTSHPTGKQHQIKHDGNLEKLPQSAQKKF